MVDVNKMIDKLKSIKFNGHLINGPVYQDIHKMLGKLYLEQKNEQLGIYHLTETHAPSLRVQTVHHYNTKQLKMKLSKSKNIEHGIHKEYVKFDSELAKQEEKGLLTRLREMPKEWTIVQVTQEKDPEEVFTKVWKPQPSCLYISRLPCGSELEINVPTSVTTEMPRGVDENMPFVYDLVEDAVNNKLKARNGGAILVRKMRDDAAKQIKAAASEISEGWLREWRCMFLGELCNPYYKEQVRKCVEPYRHGKELSEESCHKLYAVANGCAHLSTEEIQSAVAQVVGDTDKPMYQDIVQSIVKLKSDSNHLMLAKRHPVLLIVEEKLDILPWEMISVLMRHPVSRVPSLHFAHALYKEHEEHIIDGNRIIRQSDLGFYLINPDNDLKEMEKKILNFLRKRAPKWKGVSGMAPSPEEFASAFMNNNLVLYCGHGSGTNLLQGKQLEDMNLRVVAMPLLFGCSSIQLQYSGLCALPHSTAHNYLVAGSACVLGMLWLVTSQDTDAMTVFLLNNWLPGELIDLSDFDRSGEIDEPGKHEPELLRVMKPTRNVAISFSNAAALVARGLPVKMSSESEPNK